MTHVRDNDRPSFCSDCGASSSSGADLRPSRYGGDDICLDCEHTRAAEVETRGAAAVALDPVSLAAMVGVR